MSKADVVITTLCAREEPFLSCRRTVELTLPMDVKPVVLIDQDKEGAAPMVNRILQGILASGRDVIYLHNDMRCNSPGWYERLCAYADEFPKAGILTMKRLFPNGIIQEAGGAQLQYNGTSVPVGRGAFDLGQYDEPRKIPFISWGGNYIRAEMVKEVGELDPQFLPAYWEDLDYSMQVKVKGWDLMYVPVTIEHLESFTSNEEHGARIAQLSAINAQKFMQKWNFPIIDDGHIPQWY